MSAAAIALTKDPVLLAPGTPSSRVAGEAVRQNPVDQLFAQSDRLLGREGWSLAPPVGLQKIAPHDALTFDQADRRHGL